MLQEGLGQEIRRLIDRWKGAKHHSPTRKEIERNLGFLLFGVTTTRYGFTMLACCLPETPSNSRLRKIIFSQMETILVIITINIDRSDLLSFRDKFPPRTKTAKLIDKVIREI